VYIDYDSLRACQLHILVTVLNFEYFIPRVHKKVIQHPKFIRAWFDCISYGVCAVDNSDNKVWTQRQSKRLELDRSTLCLFLSTELEMFASLER